ncbi:hypothetical protein DUNSADRAFT_6581 [Dunaliella salina]|uniref:Uncharacterized protein n=1 Tax=Dunaliella salina TaxID=3046 RepID=A0ABQ7GN27_DUNSA|nr:hypothetical protein DUNSADRAFT_6581 [Dunaliella salina]|eukprot:KAF5836011.1 hypothetical protein DUNSADRAFT_6581 [Dunaliella salina]
MLGFRHVQQMASSQHAGSSQVAQKPGLNQGFRKAKGGSMRTASSALAADCQKLHCHQRQQRWSRPSVLVRSQDPGQEEEPPWVRREKERELAAQNAKEGFKLPWGLCLLFSVFTTIAAIGSIFEYVDKNPIFGLVQPDNPLWAPILLFMGITGFPTAAYLFKLGVDGFNEFSEAQDRMDGYR